MHQNQLLPIEAIKNEFLTTLQHSHVVVESPTGSGKSTQLPLWCAENGNVLVVEPRRLACRSLSRYVARLQQTPLGQNIGYAVRFESRYSDTTSVLFVTPGIALRWFAENGLANFRTIILDEFHERRWDTDLLAALLHHSFSVDSVTHPGSRRLVITSATVEGNKLSHYLGGTRLTSEGRQFPVSVRYTEENTLPKLKHLEQRVSEVIGSVVSRHDGDILVFLPGRGEIQSALACLQGKVDAELIPLHAGINNRLQDKALRTTEHRRIILATNVAETSLTIPGVKIVIDSGLERRTHHRNGRTVLGLHSISHAAAEQRRGRAGRMAPGICIRLWGKNSRLEAFTPPETEREELTELVLAAAAAGVPVQELQFPNPLPKHAVQRAQSLLYGMNAIDAQGHITAHGKRLYPLPLDPLFSHLISAMSDPATQMAMVDLSAALSVSQRLLQPSRNEYHAQQLQQWLQQGPQQEILKGSQQNMQERLPDFCDATLLIRIVREKPYDNLPLNQQAVDEARQIAAHTRSALNLPKINGGDPLPRDALLTAIAEAYPTLIFVRREKRRHAMGNGFSEVEIGNESSFSQEAEAAIVLDQHSKPGKGLSKTINIATCLAPVSLAWLHKQNIGELSISKPVLQDNTIYITQQRVYAGRLIHQELVEADSNNVIWACTALILAGKLLAPAGERLQSDITAWNLYTAIHQTGEPSLNAENWLLHRLRQLGVQSPEDLSLLEANDLQFNGIPEWEREKFEQTYPQILKLANLHMKVHYDPKKRQVTLEKISGVRKNQPQRKELPLWSGWSIQYRDSSKVVNITK
jgi:ATP-dependent helicase HrpB